MVKKMILFLLVVCVNIFGKNSQIIFENDKYIVKMRDTTMTIDSSILIKHLNIIDSILPWLNCLDTANVANKKKSNPINILAYQHDGHVYMADNWGVTFDGNGIIADISKSYCSRKVTMDEQRYYSLHNKLAPSVTIIDEKKAILLAKIFFYRILKLYNMQSDSSVYDSVVVRPNQNRYMIYYLAKVKNHISDNRSACVSIDSQNGQLVSFYVGGKNGLLKKRDMNYKSEFTYEQFMSIIDSLNKIDELHMYKQVKLELRPGLWQWKKWIWVLWGCKIENCYTSSLLVVDSETGKILKNDFKSAD